MRENETRVLIAVDLSENSLRAVDYVGSMLSCHPLADVTLLHVIKEPSPDIMPAPEDRQKEVDRMRSEILDLMEQAAGRLTSRTFQEKHIHIKIQVCTQPIHVADLILHEQQAGKYDTVVIGRRGLSKREEFLFGSISNRVVREARDCTVWVVQ